VSKLSERRREIHGLDMAQAHDELAVQRRKLFELRLQAARGDVKNHRVFTQTKKDIARLMQHIGELDHEAQVAAEGGFDETPAPQEEEA
jgi:large subunit ribosomal protein L29